MYVRCVYLCVCVCACVRACVRACVSEREEGREVGGVGERNRLASSLIFASRHLHGVTQRNRREGGVRVSAREGEGGEREGEGELGQGRGHEKA